MGKSSKKRRSHWRRALKFWLLQHVLLPALILLIRLYMRTWRYHFETREVEREIRQGHFPSVFGVWHGSLLCLVGAIQRLGRLPGVRPVVMVSPSRDGQLMGDFARRFGIASVRGSSKSRSVAALLELIEAAKEGGQALLAVDGPRGPRGVPKRGIFTLAKGARARLYILTATSRPCVRFNSWDRAELPLPFAKIRFRVDLFHDYSQCQPASDELARLQTFMLRLSEELGDDFTEVPRLSEERPA